MQAAAAANGALGFVMLVTICFCLGDLDDVLSTPTGYPFIQASTSTKELQFSRDTDKKTSLDILQRHALDRGCNRHDFDPGFTELRLCGDEHGHRFAPALVVWAGPRGAIPPFFLARNVNSISYLIRQDPAEIPFPGPRRPGYPHQRHPRDDDHLHPPHLDQFRLHDRLQPTDRARDGRAARLIHDLDRVDGLAAGPRATALARTILLPGVPGGPPRQRPRADVFGPRLRHGLLPACARSRRRVDELERRHLCRRAACLGGVLLRGGQSVLYRAGRAG